MFPQRVLGDSFNVYLRLLIESMKNQKNVFMTSKVFYIHQSTFMSILSMLCDTQEL